MKNCLHECEGSHPPSLQVVGPAGLKGGDNCPLEEVTKYLQGYDGEVGVGLESIKFRKLYGFNFIDVVRSLSM